MTAAPRPTLLAIAVGSLVGGALLVPSLCALFRVFKAAADAPKCTGSVPDPS